MEREDWEGAGACAACGVEVTADSDRPFGFGTENVLCYACAMARGGAYDPERDVWVAEPDVSGLRDEAYGASPHEMRHR